MSTIALEHVPCNLCGAAGGELFYEGVDGRYAATPRVHFRLLQCPTCGLIYLTPRPTLESLRPFYPPDFTPYRQDTIERPTTAIGLARVTHSLWNQIERLKDAQKVHLLERLHPQPARVLDIGCATGHFLSLMQRRGWHVAGVEMNEAAAQRARSALRADIHSDVLATARFPDATFDIVTMFHVLEHLPDPLWSLHYINTLLRPGGFVVILVPNADNFEFRLLRHLDRNPVDIPRHLYHFSPATLRQLVAKAGLIPTFTRGFSWDGTSRVTRVLETLTERWQPRSTGARIIRTAYELAAFALGTGIAALSGGIATAGPAFFLVAQKPG